MNGLSLREVTRENWRATLGLAVFPEQQRFVADSVPIGKLSEGLTDFAGLAHIR